MFGAGPASWFLAVLFLLLDGPASGSQAGEASGSLPELTVQLQIVYVTDESRRMVMDVNGDLVLKWIEQVNGVYGQAGIRFIWRYPDDLMAVDSRNVIDQASWAAHLDDEARLKKAESELPTLREEHMASIVGRCAGRLPCVLCIVPEVESKTETHETELTVPNGYGGWRRVKGKVRVNLQLLHPFAEFASIRPGRPRYIALANFRGAVWSFCGGSLAYERWQGTVMAHEIGHYLGLSHTFKRRFGTRFDAEKWFLEHGRNVESFDGDGLADTPPDVGIEDFRCREGGDPFFLGKTSFVVSTNLMSYSRLYGSGGARLSRSQIRIAREHVRSLGLDIRGMSAEELTGVLRKWPNHGDAIWARGLRRYGQGDLGGADTDMARLLELNPTDAGAMTLQGLSCLWRLDLPRALSLAERALQAQPGDAAALVLRGGVRRARGEDDLAGADIGQARTMNSAGNESWRDQAVLTAGDLGEPGITAGRALQILHGRIGGRPEEWSALARTIAGQDRAYGESLALYQAGSFAAALARAQEGLKRNEWQWKLWQMAGNCRIAQGDRAAAIASYRKSLELNPRNDDLRRYLDSLVSSQEPSPAAR